MSKYLTKRNIIIASCALVVIILILLIAVSCNKEEQTGPQPLDKRITVDGLTFDDSIIVGENGLYEYNVKVKNTNNNDYKLNYFIFKFYDKKGKEITSLIGYAGDIIKKGKTTTVTSTVDVDIRKAKKVEITINK